MPSLRVKVSTLRGKVSTLRGKAYAVLIVSLRMTSGKYESKYPLFVAKYDSKYPVAKQTIKTA